MKRTPTIETLLAAWIEAFNTRDLETHACLYTEDATLFGSRPTLSIGRGAIRDYFATLGHGVQVKRFDDPHIVELGADVAASAALVDFADGDTPSPYRMTWMLVRRDGDWLIAQHHGSPRIEA
jgi:uncharacterized protein (TIGR02246 family)